MVKTPQNVRCTTQRRDTDYPRWPKVGLLLLFKSYFLASAQGQAYVANSCLLMLVVSSLTPSCEIDIDVPIKVLERANRTFAQNADLLL